MYIKKYFITAAFAFALCFTSNAQEGRVHIEQDSLIPHLLELKTEMGKANKIGDRYRIQIFSGNNKAASDILKEFRSEYSQWPSTIFYDTPNYKVWVGNFRNSLAADKALLEIRESYPAAFRFRPERN